MEERRVESDILKNCLTLSQASKCLGPGGGEAEELGWRNPGRQGKSAKGTNIDTRKRENGGNEYRVRIDTKIYKYMRE